MLNQDSFFFKKAGEEYGCVIGTNDANYLGYNVRGKRSKFLINVCSNYMSRLRNKAFSFISADAIKNSSREEAMKEIEAEEKENIHRQHYWDDTDPTSFSKRKESRREITEVLQNGHNGLHIEVMENIHPLGRYFVSTYLEACRK